MPATSAHRLPLSSTAYTATDYSQVPKWIVQLIGDTEPMHNSPKPFGGNLVKVLFNGTSTNMYRVQSLCSPSLTPTYHSAGLRSRNPSLLHLHAPFCRHRLPTHLLHSHVLSHLTRIGVDDFAIPVADWMPCFDVEREAYCPRRGWGFECAGVRLQVRQVRRGDPFMARRAG